MTISKAASHAVQISNSLYRILTAKTVQLVRECQGGNKLSLIEGVYLLKLTDECPKASTPDHLFVRTPDLLVGLRKIITLPLLSQSQEWLGEVAKELDLQSALDEVAGLAIVEDKIPLRRVRENLKNRTFSLYKIFGGYVITLVAYGVIAYVTGRGILFVLRNPMFRRRRRQGGRQLPVRAPPHAGDFSDSDGDPIERPPAVVLPLAVRRQFGR